MTHFTARDCKDVGFCVDGQKEFCAAHGIDFKQYLRKGMNSKDLEGIEDANLDRVLAHVRAKQLGEQDDG